jgi:hypothetical protein
MHLRAKALGHVGRGDPVREGDEVGRVEVRRGRLTPQPGAEADFLAVEGAAAAQAVARADGEQAARPAGVVGVAREQDAALLEEFADRARTVGEVVGVTADARGRERPVRRREVAAREDVCGREGGRGAHAVDEEDAVRGRDEDDAMRANERQSVSGVLGCAGRFEGSGAAYLALGLGTAGFPRGCASFRPGMSDIFLALLRSLVGVGVGVVVAIGSCKLRRDTESWKGRDRVEGRVWRLYVAARSMDAAKSTNGDRVARQDG